MLRRKHLVAALVAALLIAPAALSAGCSRTEGSSQPEAAATETAVVTPEPAARAIEPASPTPAEPAAADATAANEEEAGAEAAAVETPAAPQFPFPDENARPTRLIIPKAKVNHAFVVRGLNAKREMEDPGGKDDVAWYNFSSLPGYGSNAVLSGHVDWYTGQRGVFWFLRDLTEGDEAEVQYSDGMVLKYRVVRVEVYGANEVPVEEITAPTSTDMLTMITCDGVFQRSTKDYTQRRVVFAERVG
jgi:LPXTG-site transpeptidase (sortase) family protein